MLAFLTSRVARMILTLWAIVTIVFFATRISGNAVDFLMPDLTIYQFTPTPPRAREAWLLAA